MYLKSPPFFRGAFFGNGEIIKKNPPKREGFKFKFPKLKILLTGEVREHSGAADLPEQA